MVDIALWIIGIAFFGAIYSLSRWVRPGLGAVGPILWVAGVVFLISKGQMVHFHDFVMAAIGFLATLTVWGGGIAARKNKQAKETNRLNNSLH